MSKMPSIEQFRHIVKTVKMQSDFAGFDENEKPIYIRKNKYPIVKAIGTVKIHGTNASIGYKPRKGMWCQSKKNVITIEKDNAGFAAFVKARQDFFETTIKYLCAAFCNEDETLILFGEFAGKGIQKGVAISEIEKSFFIFGIRITDKDGDSSWVSNKNFVKVFVNWENNNTNTYILPFIKTYEVEIDFNAPEKANNEITDLVMQVEEECPVGKYFGISGIGEGIVFKFEYNGNIYLFKAKGDKHSKTKVKKVQHIDTAIIDKCREVAGKVTPSWRLEQMYDETFDTLNGGKGDSKKTGDYIRSVIKDVLKEETDLVKEAGIAFKDLNKYVSGIAKDYLFAKLDEEAGL